MTNHEALPNEDLTFWPFEDAAWDGDDFRPAAARPAPKPWFRSSGLLLAAIGMAAAALVVATALLVAGNFSGVIPAKTRLGTRATTAETRPTAPSRTPQSSASTSASTTNATVSSTAEAPAPSAEVAPPPTTRSSAPPAVVPRPIGGPEVELTRTPMSFSPTVHPK